MGAGEGQGHGEGKTIFVDFETPVGILAPFLVHEIIHALADTKEFTVTEQLAFQGQYLFTQELRERDPGYDTFLKSQFPKAKFLHKLLEFESLDVSDSATNTAKKRA